MTLHEPKGSVRAVAMRWINQIRLNIVLTNNSGTEVGSQKSWPTSAHKSRLSIDTRILFVVQSRLALSFSSFFFWKEVGLANSMLTVWVVSFL